MKRLYLLLKTNKVADKGKYVAVYFGQNWQNAAEKTIGVLVKRMVKDLLKNE